MAAHLSGSSVSSPSYCSRSVRARKKMIPAATIRKPATEAMAMPTTSGSETYSSQCSPRYHQFSPTRHLQPTSQVQPPKTQPESHGVPQGSTSGPPLFRSSHLFMIFYIRLLLKFTRMQMILFFIYMLILNSYLHLQKLLNLFIYLFFYSKKK